MRRLIVLTIIGGIVLGKNAFAQHILPNGLTIYNTGETGWAGGYRNNFILLDNWRGSVAAQQSNTINSMHQRLPNSYIGSSGLIKVGTINQGTWNGNPIPYQYLTGVVPNTVILYVPYPMAIDGGGIINDNRTITMPKVSNTQDGYATSQMVKDINTSILSKNPLTDSQLDSIHNTESVARKGQANGYVGLNGDTLITSGNIPHIGQNYITGLSSALSGKEPVINSGMSTQFWRGDKIFAVVNKTTVGLGNVSNIDATNPSNITSDSSHRFMTDAQRNMMVYSPHAAMMETEIGQRLYSSTLHNYTSTMLTLWPQDSIILSGDPLTRTNNTSQYFNGYFNQTTGQLGDCVSQPFTISENPHISYKIKLLGLKNTSHGKAMFYIDNQSVGSIDFYGSLTYNSTFILSNFNFPTINKGQHYFSWRVFGKNASSSGYLVKITRINFLGTIIGNNLQSNAGFEMGSLANWTPSDNSVVVTASQHYQGSYSCYIPNGKNIITGYLLVDQGAQYSCALYARMAGGVVNSAKLQLFSYDSEYNLITSSNYKIVSVGENQWDLSTFIISVIQGDFVYPATCRYVRMKILKEFINSPIYIDDFDFHQIY